MSKTVEFTKRVWKSCRYFVRDIYYQFMLVFFPGKLVYNYFSDRWKDYPIDAPRIKEGVFSVGPRRVIVKPDSSVYGGKPPESPEVVMKTIESLKKQNEGMIIEVV